MISKSRPRSARPILPTGADRRSAYAPMVVVGAVLLIAQRCGLSIAALPCAETHKVLFS